MNDGRRKPFWKRKRWIAAAVLWLVLWYPLSFGPAIYFVGRGWLSADSQMGLYWPVAWAADCFNSSDLMTRYGRWCYEHGLADRL